MNKNLAFVMLFFFGLIILINIYSGVQKRRAMDDFESNKKLSLQDISLKYDSHIILINNHKSLREIEILLKSSKRVEDKNLKRATKFYDLTINYRVKKEFEFILYRLDNEGIMFFDNNYLQNDSLLKYFESFFKNDTIK
jgi:hypothetical protein